MYWQDQEENKTQYVVPGDVVDLTFKVQCKQLPLDHAHALSQVIQQELPWFVEEPLVGMHLIHGAESGNGWIRPQEPDALLSLSRRARFALRLPKHRIQEAAALAGRKLCIAGSDLILREPYEKLLSAITTIFARYIITDEVEDEATFLRQAAELLNKEGIQVKRMISGRTHVLRMPDADVQTRSLMLDGLEIEQSVYLQQHGLGAGRKMGCGLFLPHKGIDAVGQAQE